ncbi:MAG: 4-alpha-glucanotransferase [Eubacteriales bacterium]
MKRSSGVLMHVSSLWGDYSVGSFGDAAREWIDFLADCGFTYWQTLPFCLPGEMNSPYKSFSSFSGNPYFIDLPMLCRAGLITSDELNAAKQVKPYVCEFDRLERERLPLLGLAASRMTDSAPIEEFMSNHPEIERFCRYMALKKANGGKVWTEWTEHTPDADELRLWRFSQFAFFTQWSALKAYANERGIKIIGDIPIYVAHDSADVWSAPEQFQLDERGNPTSVAGVPPDYFAKDGQLWGNPLYDWERMKADGYSWWKRRLSFMLEMFDGVRIDHFLGLEVYYSIPAGAPNARSGRWVKGPGYDFIKAVKPLCGDKLIIAEDLGDITPKVEALVKKSGFPGMRVLQFGFLSEEDSMHKPHNYPENSVAYTGTHDNNTLFGYIMEAGEDERRRVFDYCGYRGNSCEESVDYMIRALFASHAQTVILPVQDLLGYGADTRMNKPGVVSGNWSFRLAGDQFRVLNREKLRHLNKIFARSK